jgi:3-demethoxyubiquinol 3-hydroxylase
MSRYTSSLDNERTINNIINVNYAGEFGAVWFYGGQLLFTRLLYPEMISVIRTIQHDEKKHRKLFLKIMPNYGLQPCRLTWIWAMTGLLLGIITPLLGKRALLMSIKAAEDTAHEHLGVQIKYLQVHDIQLAKVVADVQTEEKKHVKLSECALGNCAASRYEILVYKAVYTLCQVTMWLVTRGASSLLKQSLIE